MDLPSHVLYTYAAEKVFLSNYIKNNPEFIFTSLVSVSLPDILESTPFLIYLYINKDKYNLKNIKSVISYAADITHNRPLEYQKKFSWAAKISFYTHSFLIYITISILFYLYLLPLFLPFLIGYGLHLITDLFMHNDFFTSRPFYPITNASIPGIFTWYKSRKFIIYNYIILAVIYFYIIINSF